MRLFALGLIAVIALPASAAAKGHSQTIAPPGISGVSQYVETVPTAHGGQPVSSVHNGGGGSGHSHGGGGSGTSGGGSGGAGAISPSTQHALDSQGADGRAAAAFIQATAPTGVQSTTQGQSGTGNSASNGGASTGSNAAASQDNGPSPANAVFHALTGSSSSGGLGSILPIILIVSVLGLSTLAILRRKRTT